eukprot:scaffold1959_cov243-Pinguiococcus_pyrenoidosus.AAC.12
MSYLSSRRVLEAAVWERIASCEQRMPSLAVFASSERQRPSALSASQHLGSPSRETVLELPRRRPHLPAFRQAACEASERRRGGERSGDAPR